eukprot:3007111-Amphidinium_carterae.1
MPAPSAGVPAAKVRLSSSVCSATAGSTLPSKPYTLKHRSELKEPRSPRLKGISPRCSASSH